MAGPGPQTAGNASPLDDAAQLRLIADNLPAMSIAYDENLRCLFANQRFAAFFGWDIRSIVGLHLSEVIGEAGYQEVKPYFDTVLAGQACRYERTRVLADGSQRFLEVELIPHTGPDSRNRGLFAVTTDATARRRAEQLRLLGHSVAALVADAEDSAAAVRAVTRAICSAEAWDCGRYFRALAPGAPLTMLDGWAREDPAMQEFLQGSRRIGYEPGEGLVGGVALSGEPLWVADLEAEPAVRFRARSKRAGLQSAFVFPVKFNGKVAGVLAFNSRHPRAPDARLLQDAPVICSQIGQFLERKRAEEDLRRFRVAMDNSEDMIFLIDPVTVRYVDTNATACRKLGYSREELLRNGVHNVVCATREQLAAQYRRFMADPASACVMVGHYTRKDGSTFPFESARHVLRSGEEVLIAAISRDISGRIAAETALRESESRLRSLCSLSSDVFWEQDREFRFTSMSDSAGVIDVAQILGKPLRQFDSAGFSDQAWAAHRGLLEARMRFKDLEVLYRDAAHEQHWYSFSGEPVFAASGEFSGYRGVGRDISASKLDEKRIEHLAHHDALTGLPNRASFAGLLSAAMRNARRLGGAFAVVFIDLDRFKLVNDTLGHDAGDQLLREVARRLQEALRESDIVARLGGDEFVALLQDARDARAVEGVVQKLLLALERPLNIQGHECGISASIGISLYPEHGADQRTLMKKADLAMYCAKEAGRNAYRFYSDAVGGGSGAGGRLSLEAGLRRALECNEFYLHYQPRVNVREGSVSCVEALLRWRHPQQGEIGPAVFIPLAEESGLISRIGRWVLQAACAQAMAWQREGIHGLRMAVNISAREFDDEGLLEGIEAVLRATGLPPGRLELELTESLLAKNAERVGALLARLRESGVRLALDDFGTGYSSLGRLKQFAFDTLKVDRSFVSGLPNDRSDAGITHAIIAMGKTLGLDVVAEGIETYAQMRCLQEQGCDEMQGYLLSRPLPAGACAEFLRRHAPALRQQSALALAALPTLPTVMETA